jgi:predicted amidohydrolase
MTVDRPITVAGCQIPQNIGNREVNIRTAMDVIHATPGHDIYVLPELSSSGYDEIVFKQLEDLAEDWDGPSFEAFSRLSRDLGCYICYSFPRKRSSDEFTIIAAAVVGPTGGIEAKYDKWHVCSTGDCCEKRYFKNGKRPLEVFDVFGVRVGLCICYDIRFPELTRYLAVDKKITLLLHPGGWPRDKGFFTWHTFVTTRAMENTIYIMSTNWAGLNNGRTVFCPPFVDGDKACLSKLKSKPAVLIGTVDMAHIENEREKYPYLKDRNQDMYAKLAERS